MEDPSRPREQCISLLAVAATRMHGQQKLAAPPLIPATSVLLLVERNTVSCGKHPNYIICGAILLRVSFVDQRSRVPIFSSIALATILLSDGHGDRVFSQDWRSPRLVGCLDHVLPDLYEAPCGIVGIGSDEVDFEFALDCDTT